MLKLSDFAAAQMKEQSLKLSGESKETYSAQDAIFVVPPTLVVAPHPPMPEAPANVQELEHRHAEAVALVFGFPVSMFLSSQKQLKDTQVEDKRDFARAIKSFRTTFVERLNDLWHTVTPDAPPSAIFSLEVNTNVDAVDADTLISLLEAGAISYAEFREKARSILGLSATGGAKKKPKVKA